jgi:hypothetical protein
VLVRRVMKLAQVLRVRGRDRAQKGLGRVQVEKVRALVVAVKAKEV